MCQLRLTPNFLRPRNGRILQELTKEYRREAESCASEARLKFPKSWQTAMLRIPKVMSWLETMTLRLDPLVRMDGIDLLSRHTREFTELLAKVKGLSRTVMHITERLLAACQAQKSAIDELAGATLGLDSSQQIRMAALGTKAQAILTPIFEAGFVARPAERCVKETCERIQYGTPTRRAGLIGHVCIGDGSEGSERGSVAWCWL